MTDSFPRTGSLRPPGDIRPTAVGRRGRDDNDRQLTAACSEFEALFINLLLKELRATVAKSGLMDGGRAEDLYTGMLDTEMARDLAARGGFGLAAILYRQLDPGDAERQPAPVGIAAAETAAGDRQPPGRTGDSKVLIPAADNPNEAFSAGAGRPGPGRQRPR